jgi:hypothetical protein
MVDYIAVGSFKNAEDKEAQIKKYMETLKQRTTLDMEEQDAQIEAIRNARYGIKPIEPVRPSDVMTQKTRMDQIDLFLQLSKDVMDIDEARRYASSADPSVLRIININWSKLEGKLEDAKRQGNEITSNFLSAFIGKELLDSTSTISKARYATSVIGTEEKVPPSLKQILKDETANVDDLNTALRVYLNETYPKVWDLDSNNRKDEKRIIKHYVDIEVIGDKVRRLGKPELKAILNHEAIRKAPSKTNYIGPPVRMVGTPFRMVRTTGARIVGKGIEPNDNREPYSKFGRYRLHIPSLKNNVLNLKYRSRAMIDGIPKQVISPEFTMFLLDLVDNGALNTSLFLKLSSSEKRLFLNIAKKAQIDETLGLSHLSVDEEDDEIARFLLLKGEVEAGNNNPEILKELRTYVLRFLKDKRMRKDEALSILSEISMLI